MVSYICLVLKMTVASKASDTRPKELNEVLIITLYTIRTVGKL